MIIKIVSFILSFVIVGAITSLSTKEENVMFYKTEKTCSVDHAALRQKYREVVTASDEALKTVGAKIATIDNGIPDSGRTDVLKVTVSIEFLPESHSGITNKERVCILIDAVCNEMEFEDAALIKAMVSCESSFDTTSVSSYNAQGLMQITPRYFKSLMERYEVTDLCKDEVGNLRVGIHWISHLINKYNGDVHKALVAYNCGESVVDNRGVTSNGYSRWVLRTAGDYL